MGSSSSSKADTTSVDSRKVLGQDAIDASGGSSVTVNRLDGGAIRDAFDFGSLAFDFAGNVVNTSLDANLQALDATLAASKYSQQQAANAVSDSLSFAQFSQSQAAKQQDAALSAATDSMAGALTYGAKTTAAALDNLQSTQSLVANAYNDAKGRGAMTDYIMLAAIAMAGFVAYKSIRG